MFDLVIEGGVVFPGDVPRITADVGIQDGLVAALEPTLADREAVERIDASGLFLCPGFIDMHAHSALEPFRDPTLAPKVAQGFTTEVINPDGLAPAPVSSARRDERRSYLRGLEGDGPREWSWTTFGSYLDALEDTRPATALVPSIGHNAVRDTVMGGEARAPTRSELRALVREVRLGLEQGARTVSFGLVYLPGLYARSDELHAIAVEAARWGAPLVPHVRNEADGVLEAHREMIEIARDTGAPLHISHLKVIGHPHLVEPMLEQIDRASAEVDLTFDQYPYGAGSTVLANLAPPWALEGGAQQLLERLDDTQARARMLRDVETGVAGWENIHGTLGPQATTIAHAAGARSEDVGKSLAEIAEERGCDPFVAVMDLLLDTQLDATMVNHYATEEAVRMVFQHPRMLIGSDGIFSSRPHPRLYGTAARALGRYALRERLIEPEEAVARLTSRAAARLALTDRGIIAPGKRADLVLLDPERLLDRATFEDPIRVPAGVECVWIAGQAVWLRGQTTGKRPGGVVREPLARS